MRRIATVASLVFLASGPIESALLTAQDFVYMGYFLAPTSTPFKYGMRDMTYVSDCMTVADPTPGDGYPGCLMGSDNDFDKSLAMMDIVPPTGDGANMSAHLLGPWNVHEGLPISLGITVLTGSDELAIYYDIGPPCRIIWAYIKEYANSPMDLDPIFGYSDCDAVTPNAQGMWRFDQRRIEDYTTSNYWRVTKWVYNIKKLPAGIADDYFGGNQMVLGPGKSTGSRGSSLGPSFGVRPWTFPGSDWEDFTPILWYPSNGYPRWYIPTKFRAADDRNAYLTSRTPALEAIRINAGGTDYETVIFLHVRSEVDSRVYPYGYPTARPDESVAGGVAGAMDPPGAQWDTYYSTSNGLWPDPLTVPIEWYGIQEFNPASAAGKQPSTNIYQSTGFRMPYDSTMVSTCTHGTGPSPQAARLWLMLYDVEELGKMYAGTSVYNFDELQPYAQIDVTYDPGNDGFDLADTCTQPGTWSGMAYDHTNNLLYISTPENYQGTQPPHGVMATRAIMVYKVSPTGHAPTTPGSGTENSGQTDGGSIQ